MHHDVTCKVCGQGFLVYWARTSRSERERTRRSLVDALARHHEGTATEHAHPRTGFTIPSWSGVAAFSGAALLGGAQSWAI